MSIFLAVIGGFCFRGALQAAIDGNAWMALILGALAVVDIAAAIATEAMKR